MRSTTVDSTSPSALCAAPQWMEHLHMLYAHTTVDRTSPSGLCAAPQWIKHLQVVYVQHHSG